VVGSVQQYVEDRLGNVLNTSRSAIDFGAGASFKDADLDQWIQVTMLGPTQPGYIGQIAGRLGDAYTVDGNRGREMYWLVNVNCFVRPGVTTVFSNLQIWQLRDAVFDAFSVGKLITVKDYVGTGETIGNLFVHDLMSERRITDPERVELVQHNLLFALRWTETWTADV
jgi:hypothetical protein